ncbi:MAG: AAA family ATPase [Actinobacteria bacterium]|nr:AAA family ATPase [Actinomycetota bacterium]MCL5446724.1 AAA family ATPase [Actinomycetota bacterium]
MRITGWHIDGFGIFSGYNVDNLPPGLTVIHGPNEAGKSTTMAFIRGVLFGFPSGRSSGNRYPPLNGGRHGGRLFIDAVAPRNGASDSEQWVVERNSGLASGTSRSSAAGSLSVTLPGGSPGTPEDLDQLLGHAGRELFRNIFAFSLSELESFRTLEGDAVRERIFSSSTVGAARSPNDVIGILDRRIAALLKRRSATAEVNDAMGKLDIVLNKIHDAKSAAADYPRIVQKRETLAQDIVRIEDSLQLAGRNLSMYQKLIDLWPDWLERSNALEELERIEIPEELPDGMEAHLRDLRNALHDARARRDERLKDLERDQRRLERIATDDSLVAIANDVKSLYRDMSAYEGHIEQLGEIEAKKDHEQRILDDQLSLLGPRWNRTRLESLDVSIPAANEVTAWNSKLELARDQLTDSDRSLKGQEDRIDTVRNDLDKIRAEFNDYNSTPDLDTLANDERFVQQLHSLLDDRVVAQGKLEDAEHIVEDRQAQLAIMPKSSATGTIPFWAIYAIILFMGVGAVAMIVFRQWLAVALLLVAALSMLVMSRRLPSASVSEEAQEAAGGLLDKARTSREQRVQELSALNTQIAQYATYFNLPPSPSRSDVAERATLLSRQRDARIRADDLARQIGELELTLQGLESRLQELIDERSSRQVKVTEITNEWESWRRGHGVPESMSPEAVTDLFTSIKRARETLSTLDDDTRRAISLRRKIQQFDERARDVISKVGLDPGDGGHTIATSSEYHYDSNSLGKLDTAAGGATLTTRIHNLYEKILEDEEARRSKEGLEAATEHARKEWKDAEDKLQEVTRNLDDLLRSAGAANEGELEEFIKRSARRHELESTVNAATTRIDAKLGLGEAAENMRSELATGDRTRWEAQLDIIAQQIDLLDAEKQEAIEHKTRAVDEDNRVAELSDLASLEIEAEGLRLQIADALERWQVAKAAKYLIEQTLDRYEREHQPQVVARASKLFAGIAGGRYRQLMTREGSIQVLNSHSQIVDVEQLSTGTAQQLYLCIRFGLADEFAQRGTLLPFIMDEVLVNFDPDRAQAVAETIAKVSTARQVLMFTCHPETVDMITQACIRADVPPPRIIDLKET